MKVSFDFDDTLAKRRVQKFARWCVAQGHEVHIVTSRYSEKIRRNWNQSGYNDDLFSVADDLGIPRSKIHFTNLQPKATFFLNSDFVWHLDDDPVELEEINDQTSVKAINVRGSFWIKQCKELL